MLKEIIIKSCEPVYLGTMPVSLKIEIKKIGGNTLTRSIPICSVSQISLSLLKKFFPEIKNELSFEFTDNQIKKHFTENFWKLEDYSGTIHDMDDEYTNGWIWKKKKFYFSKQSNQLKQFLVDNRYKETYVPLILYSLLATNSALYYEENDFQINFIMSLTGGSANVREAIAIACCNTTAPKKESKSLKKSDYNLVHVTTRDSLATIFSKAVRCKDGVLLVFNPSLQQYKFLEELYINRNYKKISNMIKTNQKLKNHISLYQGPLPLGGCLIVTDKESDIPFSTMNVEIDPDTELHGLIILGHQAGINKIEKTLDIDIKKIKIGHHQQALTPIFINDYIETTTHRVNLSYSNPKILNDKYKPNPIKVKHHPQDQLISKFNHVLELLYCAGTHDEGILTEYGSIIEKIIIDTFPKKDELSKKEKTRLKNLCIDIDKYFNHKNEKCLIHCSKNFSLDTTKAWYTKEHIYFLPHTLNDIVKITGGKNFERSDAEKLYQLHLMHKNDPVSKDGTSPSFIKVAGVSTEQTYYIFNRNMCKDYFKRIESIIAQRKDYSDKEFLAEYAPKDPKPKKTMMETMMEKFKEKGVMTPSDIKKDLNRYHTSGYINKALAKGYITEETGGKRKTYHFVKMPDEKESPTANILNKNTII